MPDIVLLSEDIREDAAMFSSLYSSKTIIPAHRLLKVNTLDGDFLMCGCNSEIYVTSSIKPHSLNVAVVFCVDGEPFFRAVKNMSGNINIDIGDNITVSDEHVSFSLPKFSADDFILRPQVTEPLSTIEGFELYKALDTCLPFIGNDDLKPSLLGVSVFNKDNKVIFGAGNWKAMAIYYADASVIEMANVLLSGTSLKILLSSPDLAHDSVVVYYSDNWVRFVFSNKDVYISRMDMSVNGANVIEFYVNDIPREINIDISPSELLSTLRSMDGFYSDLKHVKFIFSDHQITIEAQNDFRGISAKATMPYHGEHHTSSMVDVGEIKRALSKAESEKISVALDNVPAQKHSVIIRDSERTFVLSAYM